MGDGNVTPQNIFCTTSLNLYKTPELQGLVTQAAAGRHVRLLLFSFRTWG